MKLGHYLWAVMLFSALAMQASSAEEAVSGSREMGAASSAKSDGADVKAATGQGTRAGAKDVDLDTRITGPSDRLAKRPDKPGDVKTIAKPGAPENFRTRQIPSPGTIENTARNAIGLPIANRASSQGQNAVRQDSPPAAGNAGGIARNAAGGLANANPGGGPTAYQRATPVATATALNQAAINGTRLTRPGYSLGIVGGAAKTTTGINGTTVRLKY